MHRPFTFTIALLVITSACETSAGKPSRLRVGDEPLDAGAPRTEPASNPDNAPALMGTAGGASVRVEQPLSVAIIDAAGMPVSEVALPCPQGCIDVKAVAMGGNPPYQFAWADGSNEPARKLCSSQANTLSVVATDTATQTAEFRHEMQRAAAQLQLSILPCVPPVTTVPDTSNQTPNTCKQDTTARPTCNLPGGHRLPEEITVDIPGATQRRFAGGAKLPAGRYRIEYVTGCNTYGIVELCGWTIHGSSNMPGLMSCFVVGNDTTVIGLTPGTVGALLEGDPMAGGGAFKTYDECIKANCSDPPFDFMFGGGTLGVQRDGGGTLGAIDDLGGEAVGGHSPTFRLSRLDPCP